jgi:formylglycine-generating enzyme
MIASHFAGFVTLAALAGCLSACQPGKPPPPSISPDEGGASSGRDAPGGSPSHDSQIESSNGSNASDELWSRCNHAPVEARCRDGWCEIPAGCFVMGSPEGEWGRALYQEEQVLVTLTRPFIIQQTEVTQEQWTSRGLANPSRRLQDGRGDCLDSRCPVGGVTWFEAVTYANLLSERHDPPLEHCYILHGCQGEVGNDFYCTAAEAAKPTVYECDGFRLATDAEWEYAARAGTRTAFYSGDITFHEEFRSERTACLPDSALERIAWYCWNSGGTTHPVGQLEPNGWGLFDMVGNAAELLNDRNDGLPPRTAVDPGGTVGLHTNRTRCGGSYFSWSSICRSADKLSENWNMRGFSTTLRLVRTGTLDDL